MWLAVVFLSACGAFHATAKIKLPCPAGDTLIRGRFHFQACVASTKARVARICAKTGYELRVILSRDRYPIPDAVRSELTREAKESETTLVDAITAMKATGESDSNELAALSPDRASMRELELQAVQGSGRQVSVSELFKPFEFRPCIR